MQKDLIFKIDTLIEMSKSTSNIDTLKAELIEINEELENKKLALEEQRKSMQDEKYIKASDRIIDENIKVSLELKIRKLENSLKELEKNLKDALKKEDDTHTHLETMKSKIAKLNALIETLREKLSFISEEDQENKKYYQDLIGETEKKRNKADVEKKLTEEEYRRAVENLNELTSSVETLKNKIATEKEKLRDTEMNLSSNTSYIDTNLKQEDEKRLQELEEKLDSLEQRKEEIQNDAVMIGNEAKELLLEDDRTGCFLKVKELVNLLKKNPYMDIATSDEFQSVLASAEERAVMERDEFAASLENKKYDGNDAPIILEREKHLEHQKQDLENELLNLKMKIKNIDTVKIREISALLSSANVVSETLRKDLAEYQKVMEISTENATPRKKAILTAAFNKKEEELKSIQAVIEAYEQEMQELMKESKNIATIDITNIQNKIVQIEEYLKEIQKKNMISSKTKDVLAVENDKSHLKELNSQVKEISSMKKFLQTPSEIYSEIEQTLGSFITSEYEEEIIPEEKIEEPEINNFRITEDVDNTKSLNRAQKNKNVLEEPSIEPEERKEEIIEEVIPTMENVTSPTEVESNSQSDLMPMDFDFDTKVSEEPEVLESILDNDIFEEPSNLVDSVNASLEQAPLEEISTQEIESIPETNLEPINMDEILPLDMMEQAPVKERFKVIHVEPLNQEETTSSTSESFSQDDVMISDFKDDDYIDFNSLLDGGNV